MLKSLKNALLAAPNIRLNIRIGLNGIDSKTKEFLDEVKKNNIFNHFEVIYIASKQTPAEARNRICQELSSDWILFLDDDVEIPLNFLKNFVCLASEHQNVKVWGGPNLTPQSSTLVEKKIGWILENFLIVGPVSSRYRKSKLFRFLPNEFHLTLCNLFIKREVFNKILFNGFLKTAEENELIYRVSEDKHVIKFDELLFVWHHRRKSFSEFLSQVKYYGFGRGQLLYSVKFRNKVVLFSILILASFMPLLFPAHAVLFFVIWKILVLVDYFFSFQKKSLKFIIMPLSVWVHYVLGIALGYWHAFRESKRSYLYSRT